MVEEMVEEAQQRAAESAAPVQVPASAKVRLAISHLHVPATLGPVRDVSFAVHAGECVGLVGLQGSGSATVADAIVGLVKPAAGEDKLDGKANPKGPGHANFPQGGGDGAE